MRRESFNKYLRVMIANTYKKDVYSPLIHSTLYQLAIHLMFMVDVLAISLLGRSSDQFFAAEIIRQRLSADLKDISDISQFWYYMEHGPIISYLHGMKNNKNSWSVIAGDNIICGTMRLRQIRLNYEVCKRQLYKNYICYPQYKSASQINNFLTPYWMWSWIDSSLTKSQDVQGSLFRYGGEGYVVNLNLSRRFNIAQLRQLKTATWIDRGTRAVFVEFTTYNPNVNLFCSVVIVFEIGLEGGMSAVVRVSTLKLPTYLTSHDFYALGFNISLLIFALMFIFVHLFSIIFYKNVSLLNIWNLMDLLAFIPIGLLAYTFISLHLKGNKLLTLLSTWKYGYFNIRDEIQLYSLYMDSVAFLALFGLLRTFRFFRFVTRTHKLMQTVKLALSSSVSFFFVFSVVFVAFAFWAFLLFGPYINTYSTPFKSIYALYLILAGEFDYTHFVGSDLWPPLFFCLFLCIVFFVLINMFIAIITES